jgi:outer membrane protein assembly factor BamB
MSHKSNRLLHLGSSAALALAVSAGWADAQTSTVANYHNTPDHAGVFIVPGLTNQNVGSTTQDTAFNGTVSGVINAAPLYWRATGASSGTVIVATENNVVSALDETTGLPVWSTNLGTPDPHSNTCGNINPVGVTSTPVIDPASGTLYVEAFVDGAGGSGAHQLFALSLSNGAILPNWPVAVGAGVRALGARFDEDVQEQRGALNLVNGNVYIPFAGYDGDCGDYHGVVAAVATTGTPAVAHAFETADKRGGIWGPSGIISDGSSIFFATGNTEDTPSYAGGEAVIHLPPTLSLGNKSAANYFSPSNWQTLDDEDLDLGGVAPTLIDLPGATPSTLMLALGKDGNAYLLNRANLGGIGKALDTVSVASNQIHSATARYSVGSDVYVAVNAHSPTCAGGSNQAGLLVLKVAGATPKVSQAWCAALNGRGDPVVTTSDGTSNPIVWITGAEGDEELHAFDGVSGAALYSSPALSSTIAHFSTLLVANGKLFVPSANRVVAYTLP